MNDDSLALLQADNARLRAATERFATAVAELRRAQTLILEQNDVLKMIATDQPLPITLSALLHSIERQDEELLCCILLLDATGRQLRHGAASRLPEAYRHAIDGLAVGPVAGSCGTAAFRGKPVLVTDIANDPLWQDWCDLADQYGLRACWSVPILSTTRRVLGTVATYYRRVRGPTPRHRQLIEMARHTAAIAIEQQQARALLRQSQERRFQALIENSADAIALLAADGRILYTSPAHERMLGYTQDEVIGRNAFEFVLPADHELLRQRLAEAVANPRQGITGCLQVRHKDGSWRLLEGVFTSLLDEPAVRAIVNNYHDVTERHRTDRQLRASLQEKDVLLKEIHHRVKNNLQIISSLLDLQADAITDIQTRDTFLESQNRVRSMALIHERLYRSQNLARIDFADYVESLVEHLCRCYLSLTHQVQLRLAIMPVTLSVEIAVPCGLIINELVSNALKYAFPDNRPGALAIELAALSPQHWRLRVKDDGVGLPPGFQLAQSTSLGLTIVTTLVRQLKGTFALHSEKGAECLIILPNPSQHD